MMQSSSRLVSSVIPSKAFKAFPLLLIFLLLFSQLSFASIAKWTKPFSQSSADPVIDSDSVYVATTSGDVHRIDKSSGSVLWSKEVSGSIFVPPTIHDDLVYVATSDGVFSLNRLTGNEVGKYGTSPQKVLTSPLVSSDRLFVVSESKVLIFDLSGKLESPKVVNLNGDTDSSSFASGNGISLFLTDGRLIHISAAGNMETMLNIDNPVWKAGPLQDGDMIYFSSERRLYAISTSGVVNWYKDFNGWVSPPALHRDKLYVGCNDGYLYIFNKTGEAAGKFRTEDAVSKPTMSNTTIYVPSKDNHIYAIDINSLERKWNMTIDDWPSAPLLSESVLYTLSYNGTLYAASTLGCEITEPISNSKIAPKPRISGISYSDTSVRMVEVKIGDGAWMPTKLSSGNWSIDYVVTNATEGANLTVQCRASDAANTEIAPYNSIYSTYVNSEDRLPKIVAIYPEKVTSGNDFTVKFTDEIGNPLPGVVLEYASREYEAANGSVTVTAQEGFTSLRAERPNYNGVTVTIQVEQPSFTAYIIPAAAVIFVILIILVLFGTKRWR